MRKRIDWEQVKQRLNAAQMTERAQALDAARLQKVLAARAAALASRKAAVDENADALHLLTFTLGPERYALELSELSEVLPLQLLTPVPDAPAEISGVINLRGEIATVIDLARVLDLPPGAAPGGYILLLRHGAGDLGLKVEQLGQVDRVQKKDVVAANESAAARPSRFVTGMTRDNTLILSTDALLTHGVFAAG